jgi:hypothetical protein
LTAVKRHSLCGYWKVTAANGKTAILKQTDLGPAPFTGRQRRRQLQGRGKRFRAAASDGSGASKRGTGETGVKRCGQLSEWSQPKVSPRAAPGLSRRPLADRQAPVKPTLRSIGQTPKRVKIQPALRGHG